MCMSRNKKERRSHTLPPPSSHGVFQKTHRTSPAFKHTRLKKKKNWKNSGHPPCHSERSTNWHPIWSDIAYQVSFKESQESQQSHASFVRHVTLHLLSQFALAPNLRFMGNELSKTLVNPVQWHHVAFQWHLLPQRGGHPKREEGETASPKAAGSLLVLWGGAPFLLFSFACFPSRSFGWCCFFPPCFFGVMLPPSLTRFGGRAFPPSPFSLLF